MSHSGSGCLKPLDGWSGMEVSIRHHHDLRQMGDHDFPKTVKSSDRPTIAVLRDKFAYDPDSGIVTHKSGPRAQLAAGTLCAGGRYLTVKVGKKRLVAHLVAWALMKGSYPDQTVDHANGNGLDNQWSNLRLANQAQQNANRRGWAKSGVKGVTQAGRKWAAYARAHRKTHYLGTFESIADAGLAVQRFRTHHWGEFAA